MPLVGTERLVRMLPAPLHPALCLHTFVLLERAGTTALLLDFLPERPTHPSTAAALLSGGGVRGLARARRLESRGAVEAVAHVIRVVAEVEEVEGEEEEQQGGASPLERRARAAGEQAAARELTLLRNDCRTHTAAVLETLLGRPVGRADVEAWLR
jgi:hypothetical protein